MRDDLTCPSSRPDFAHSEIIGIVLPDSTGTRAVQFLPDPVPVGRAIHDLPGAVALPEFLRFASPCAESGCANFSDDRCAVATRVADHDAVAVSLPACNVRATCRWFRQEGRSICLRCPGVVTDVLVEAEGRIA